MTHKTVLPESWKQPQGYSNAIVAEGKTLFLAGQIGWNSDEKFTSEELIPQFQQSLENIITLVETAGGCITDICRMTIFCTDKKQYYASRKLLSAMWKSTMGSHYPCMSMIFVSDLLDDRALIEIEATAVIA